MYDIASLDYSPVYAKKLFRDAFSSICHKSPIEKKRYRKDFSSVTEEQIFHILRVEAELPARIIFGYEGYTSEFGFREGFIKFVEENKSEPTAPKHGFGPMNYPDLIINGEFCFVKGNAMPYIGAMKDGQWPFYLSSAERPLFKMLEIIWTRLSYRFELDPSIFGDDLQIEGLNGFLFGNMVNISGCRAWNFEYLPMKASELEQPFDNKEWEPVSITEEQHHVIAYLCKYESLPVLNINTWMSKIDNEVDIPTFVQELVQTGLVYVTEDNRLKLLTQRCQCIYIPGRGFIASDNKTGKLTRWYEKKFGPIKNALHIQSL